jgi:Phage virion morphogenesis family
VSVLIAYHSAGAILKRMQGRLNRLRDKRTANARAVAFIDSWIQRNFREQGKRAMDGTGWQPLAPSTIARRRHGKNKSLAGVVAILQNRGWLRDKWKHLYTSEKIAVQSSMDYGHFHDSDEPRTRLPQRRIVPRVRQVRKPLMEIYRRHMTEALK